MEKILNPHPKPQQGDMFLTPTGCNYTGGIMLIPQTPTGCQNARDMIVVPIPKPRRDDMIVTPTG